MTIVQEQALRLATAAAMVTALAGNASADELSFNFALSNGTQSASANFTFSAAYELAPVTLRIELTNTMESNGGPNWLTGLFFNLAESPTLTYDSLVAPLGMITLEGSQQNDYLDAEGDPGDPANFWAYRGVDHNDLFPGELPFGDQQYGLGAAGLDIFGLQDILNHPNVPGDILPQPAGSDGGILANIDGLSVPAGHEGRPFVLGSLVFEFLLEDGFVLSDAGVGNIAFVFGTGFEEVVLIPLPLPVAMAGAGLMIVVCFRRRLVALAGR